ncbi:MAG: FAD-binding oxidoreductase [Bacteroidales bacterium]|nr:FAD-binding oxidoreductase [Bacteroidales bacterium]
MSLFRKRLKEIIPAGRRYTDPLRTLAWGTDAGFYRMIPQVVVRSKTEEEVSQILAAANEEGVAVTFRAAGTSLSGQAVSDSVLLVAGKNWEKYQFHPQDNTITLQPGIVGARVNAILSKYGRCFGPDPASIGSCMVGGIVMNNASGMSCGTHANSDKEMVSARIVFADGTILDTASAESRNEFRLSHKAFLEGIEGIRDEIQSDRKLSERIKYKYSIKNVTGLNLLPFVRFTDPFDIIAHLLVGSEGTLAFLSEVTMNTLPIAPFKASAMIYFDTISDAARAVVAMKKLDVSAAELLDIRSLTSVNDPHLSPSKQDLTAVLTEVRAASAKELDNKISAVQAALKPFGCEVRFTSDPKEYAPYWAIRAGIFPTVGGLRKQGTTCLIEDVAFHIEDLPQATADLSALLDKHGYDDSCIYGHALEGNFHFIINQAFDSDAEVARYEAMIRDVAEMVVGKYDGSLKAEHGTGRNMAPFVEYEWGEKAFGIMKRVKALFDPKGILNPGVIFNDDPKCFIKNFKALPVLKPKTGADEPELAEAYKRLNKCIECGFCEVNCLSCGFTLSSRTRIVAQREIARLEADGSNPKRLKALKKQYGYLGEKTCAGDGLCSMSCPMGINVADLTHQLRREKYPVGSLGYKAGEFAADHLAGLKKGVRGALRTASFTSNIIGGTAMGAVCKGLHNGIKLPLWTPSTPKAYKVPKSLKKGVGDAAMKVVYFPSCLNQMMGISAKKSPVKTPLAEEMTALLRKAGYEVIFPENMDSLCCGTIWESKGMPEIADRKTAELEEALWEASQQGKYPVLCDQSPCLHRMRKKIKKMQLYEPAEFIYDFLMPHLEVVRKEPKVAVHTTCSTREMGLKDKLIELAKLCAEDVIVPEGVGCCGFAGDKGMNTPELNKYALRKLKDEVAGVPVGYSNSRTCEIGLATHSGIPYVSIAYLVNKCTKAK